MSFPPAGPQTQDSWQSSNWVHTWFAIPTKTVKFCADADSEAGTTEVASLADTATTGLQPLETVLTAEVVGKLGPEGTTLAQRLHEDMGENAQVLREITTLWELSKVSRDFTVFWLACCVNLWRIYCWLARRHVCLLEGTFRLKTRVIVWRKFFIKHVWLI